MIDSDPSARVASHPVFEQQEGDLSLREALSREELTEIGGVVLHAIENLDLVQARASHDEIADGQNPNRHGPGMFVGTPEVGVDMRAGSAYRSVDVRAIGDLVESGVVRGAYTATGGNRANTRGHSTFWSDGKEGTKHSFNTPGHMIIEAPIDALDAGWVTADQVTAIHAQDKDGQVRDILQEARDAAESSDK